MPDSLEARRPYDSPRRRNQARATRRAILEAARALLLDRGYVATTIDAIAARASVSPESVYATFGTKRALLSELVDVSIAGGDEALPILEQAWVREMRDEPDPRRRARILARNGRSILERRSALEEVVRGAAAADPEMATLWERGKTQRFSGQRELLRIVAEGADLVEGVDLETAAEIMYAIGSPEVYRLLVRDRGWTGATFEQWYGDTLVRLLFDQASLTRPESSRS